MSFKKIALSCALALGLASGANAAVIFSAVGGTINSGGPGFGSLTETFDQSGLSVGYTDGVTDFDTYIAGDPRHTNIFSGFEWFSNDGSTSASVTYDFGSVRAVDALALWNEESSGIGLLDLFWSVNNVDFFALSLGLLPTDNADVSSGGTYGADVFSFASVDAQYIRFDMSGCPQDDPGSFAGCGIGEVAFREGVSAIPEPATWLMLILGFGMIGMAAKRRRQIALS